MTRMNWERARRPGRYAVENSPFRPWSDMELLRGHVQHKPKAPTTPAGPMTLARLIPFGFNRLSIHCPACRTTEHRELGGLDAEVLQHPLDSLGETVRCGECGGSATVAPFRCEARTIAG